MVAAPTKAADSGSNGAGMKRHELPATLVRSHHPGITNDQIDAYLVEWGEPVA
jgi:hypothetical protein